MYTENELKALEAADKAFAEVRKVALEFARQTGMHYHRKMTCWTSESYFTPQSMGNERWNTVRNLDKVTDNNEAIECAWAIENMWNNAVTKIHDRYEEHIFYYITAETSNEEDHYDRRIAEDLNAHSKLCDEIGKLVEAWYDSATDCAYNEFLEDVA